MQGMGRMGCLNCSRTLDLDRIVRILTSAGLPAAAEKNRQVMEICKVVSLHADMRIAR
jgi:hypothetical protein